jgi:hypothetical protein
MKKIISADHSGFNCTFEAVATKKEAVAFAKNLKMDLDRFFEGDMPMYCNQEIKDGAWEKHVQGFINGKIDEVKCFGDGGKGRDWQFEIKKGAALGGNYYSVSGWYDGGDFAETDMQLTDKFFLKTCSPFSGMPNIMIINGKKYSIRSMYDDLK